MLCVGRFFLCVCFEITLLCWKFLTERRTWKLPTKNFLRHKNFGQEIRGFDYHSPGPTKLGCYGTGVVEVSLYFDIQKLIWRCSQVEKHIQDVSGNSSYPCCSIEALKDLGATATTMSDDETLVSFVPLFITWCCVSYVWFRVLQTLVQNYSRTPLIRINWDGEKSGYAENPDN